MNFPGLLGYFLAQFLPKIAIFYEILSCTAQFIWNWIILIASYRSTSGYTRAILYTTQSTDEHAKSLTRLEKPVGESVKTSEMGC